MPVYRVYFVGGDDHFIDSENLEAEDDARIIASAGDLCSKNPRCV